MKRLILAAALLVAGCGGVERDAAGSPIPPAEVSSLCADSVKTLADVLFEMDSRLNIGMNFQAYGEKVADARVAYDRIDFRDIEPECVIGAGIPLEKAMNAYIEAYSTWNDCVKDSACDNDSVTPTLQGKWAEATALLAEVRDRLP